MKKKYGVERCVPCFDKPKPRKDGVRYRTLRPAQKSKATAESLDGKLSKVIAFYESEKGHKLWMKNKARGVCWEDNIIDLCMKADHTTDPEELEALFLRVSDILVERGIVRVPA